MAAEVSRRYGAIVREDFDRRRGYGAMFEKSLQASAGGPLETRSLGHPDFADLEVGAKETADMVAVFLDLTNFTGRTPGLPASGMTMFGENGFLLGPQAFASESELASTLAHESYRLATSQSASGVSAGLASAETQSAFSFAQQVAPYVMGR